MTVTQQLETRADLVGGPDGEPVVPGPDESHPTDAPSRGSRSTPAPVVTTRPTFTITEAASACSVSRKTITRKLPELSNHGAAKDDDGVWRIPVEALLAVGLHPGRSLAPDVTAPARRVPPAEHPQPESRSAPDTVTVPRERWDDLRIRLARAEAEAAERALALADARLALRALTAGPAGRGSESDAAGTNHLGSVGDTFNHVPAGLQYPQPLGQPPAEAVAPFVASPAQRADPDPRPAPMPAATMPAATTPAGPQVPAEAATGPAGPASPEPVNPGPLNAPGPGQDDVMAARNLAARTGGYVPATAPATRKRRWWRSA